MGTIAAATPFAERSADSYRRFRHFAWAVLAYNILVVLWGAYVRATGSGAGCGSHWPLCNGVVIPPAPETKTIIEFTHRLTSGLAGLFVFGMGLWAWRAFPRRHPVRLWAGLSVIFIIIEALLGAGLVLWRLVENDDSVARAISMPLHLVNTQILLTCLVATAWFARSSPPPHAFRGRPRLLLWTLPLTLAVSATGAIAALGDTLFPATSLAAGIREDFSSTSHFLLQLRLVHPFLAVASGVFIIYASMTTIKTGAPVARIAWAAVTLTLVQLGLGALNVILLAPVWMQIVHLLVADLLWVALVIMVLSSHADHN